MSFTPISGSDSRTGDLRVVLPASTSGRTGLSSSLSLEVGATLLARVVSQDAGEVTLALLGRLVACRSQLELPVGALVNLLVREVRPDRVVLSPQTLPNGSTVDHSAERELLKSLGLPDSPEAVFVAKRLLAEGHPLEQRLFQEVWQGLKRLGLIERSGTSASGATSGTELGATAGAKAEPAAGSTAGSAGGSAASTAAGSAAGEASGAAQPGSGASARSAELADPARPGATAVGSTGAAAANATGSSGTVTSVSTAALNGSKSDAATALSLLNGHSVEAVVNAVAFLAANGRPITPDSVRAVLAMRDADPDLGQLIQDLAKAVADLESSLDGRSYAGASLAAGSRASGAPASPALPPSLAQSLRDLGNLLADLRFNPLVEGGSLDALSARLADVLGKLGLDHEVQLGLLFGGPSSESATTATLAEQLIESETAQALVAQQSLGEAASEIFTSGRAQSQAGRPEISQAPASGTGNGVGAGAGAAKAGVDSAESQTASAAPNSGALQDSAAKGASEAHGTLKGLLLAVREQLKELGFGTGTGSGTSPAAGANTATGQAGTAATAGKAQLDEATALAKLAKTAAEALDNLTGQRLAGQAPERPGQTPVELLVQIPVQVGKETQTAELKFFVDRDGKKRNGLLKETVRVSCRLTTSNMGQVRLDLNLRGKLVDCHLTLANEEVLTYLHEHQAELEQAFKEAGLQSGTVSYARKQPDEPGETAARPLSHFSVRL